MRKDFKIIAKHVEKGASVLDLGCGNGNLLAYLIDRNGVTGRGIEVDFERVIDCLGKGISVVHSDMMDGLALYPNNFFDVVILSRTIQEIPEPHRVIQEMMRVGKKSIIAFLNYAFILNRLNFFFYGRQPRNSALPYEWQSTPNIHPLGIRDFEHYCKSHDLRILKKTFLKGDWESEIRFMPNLLAGYALYLVASPSD